MSYKESNNEDLLGRMYSYRRSYVQKELEKSGFFHQSGPKTPMEESITSMHYFGYQTIRDAQKSISPGKTGHILDAGSGFGGSARYWVEQLETENTIVACEYNSEFDELSSIATNSLDKSVSSRITHVCDDLTTARFTGPKFDGVYSILVFLHIPKRDLSALFKNLSDQMNDNTVIFIEDYYMDKEPDESLQLIGKDYIAWDDLPTKQEYCQALESAGFKVESFSDESDRWYNYTLDRQKVYLEHYDEKVKFHGEQNGTIQLKQFFNAVTKYFEQGGQGARIIARKSA